jgi:hypothetical protein
MAKGDPGHNSSNKSPDRRPVYEAGPAVEARPEPESETMSNATVLAAPAATPHIAEPATCLHCPHPAADHSSLCRDCIVVADQIEAAFPAPRESWVGPLQGPTIHTRDGLTLLLDPHADLDRPEVVAWGVEDPAALRPMTLAHARARGEALMEEFPDDLEYEAYRAIKGWYAEAQV